MIHFNNLSFSYDNPNTIFKDLTWGIENPKEGNFIHFILSPSGYGKSTLFKLILGIIKPNQGDISINESARIAYVPQEPILFEHLSIYDNATFFKNISARKKEFDNERFNEFAKALGFDDSLLLSDKNVIQLSGGQKRKLSLLKALSLNPNILLLDEPTTGLDAKVKMEFLSQLKTLAEEHHILVLYVTHHFEEAVLIGEKIHYLMKNTNDSINEISTQSVEDFKQSPPCLEAAYLVDFPDNRIQKGFFDGVTFMKRKNGNFHKRNIDEKISIYDETGKLIINQ